MAGNKLIEQKLTAGHSHRTAGGAAPESIGKSFSSDHPGDLAPVHPHCPHGAVLLDPCGYAHGNAVYNIQQGNQGDDSQKSIYAGYKSKICAGGAFIALIVKYIPTACRPPQRLDVLIGRITCCLDHNQGVILHIRQAGKRIPGGDQCNLAVSKAVTAEGVIFQQTGDFQFTASHQNPVADPQGTVLIPGCQDMTAVSINL